MTKLIVLLVSLFGGAGLLRWFAHWRESGQGGAGSAPAVLSSSQPAGGEAPGDAELVSLLREELGPRFTHAAAIDIRARDGVVTLDGSVLASEHERLLAHVRAFRGVRAVQDRLRPQRQRGDLPDVHTGSDRHDDQAG